MGFEEDCYRISNSPLRLWATFPRVCLLPLQYQDRARTDQGQFCVVGISVLRTLAIVKSPCSTRWLTVPFPVPTWEHRFKLPRESLWSVWNMADKNISCTWSLMEPYLDVQIVSNMRVNVTIIHWITFLTSLVIFWNIHNSTFFQ